MKLFLMLLLSLLIILPAYSDEFPNTTKPTEGIIIKSSEVDDFNKISKRLQVASGGGACVREKIAQMKITKAEIKKMGWKKATNLQMKIMKKCRCTPLATKLRQEIYDIIDKHPNWKGQRITSKEGNPSSTIDLNDFDKIKKSAKILCK